MTASLPRCVALLLLVLPFALAVAVAHDDTEVERLIKQLGSDAFKERDDAKRLVTLAREYVGEENGRVADPLLREVSAPAVLRHRE